PGLHDGRPPGCTRNLIRAPGHRWPLRLLEAGADIIDFRSAKLGEDGERFLPAGPGVIYTLSTGEGEPKEVKCLSLVPVPPGVSMDFQSPLEAVNGLVDASKLLVD